MSIPDEEQPPASVAPRGVHDMTRGSIRAHVVRMMLFVLAGLVIQTLYGLVDIYWVGRLGKEAVAAVAMSSNLMFVSMAVTQMLSVGCVALVSQAAGRKDHEEVQRLFNQAQSLSTFAGVVFLTVCLALRHTYAVELAGDPLTAQLSETFLGAFVPALGLQFLMVGMAAALRGIGDMRPGLVAQTSSVLLNMVIAPVLVFGWMPGIPPLGVDGASIATLVSTIAAVAGLTIYLVRGGTFLRLRFSLWRPDLRLWGRMLGIGLPAGTEFLLLSIITGVVYGITKQFGAEAQAGYGIGARVMQAAFMPAVALSFSVAAVVGQNVGAKEHDRVHLTLWESMKLTVGFMLVVSLVCHFTPEPIVRVFSADPRVIAAGSDYLRTVSYALVMSGTVFVAAGIFQGLGNTWPSLMASALRATAFVVPVVWWSRTPGFQMHGIWQLMIVRTSSNSRSARSCCAASWA